MDTEYNVPFKKLTTLKVGGVATRVVYPREETEFVAFLTKENEPLLILGGGSNVLPSEKDFSGTVCVMKTNQVSFITEGDNVSLTAAAGVPWDGVVAYAVFYGWWGFENLSGIPGTVGGAVVQNIGAYGAVLSQTLVSVRAFDRETKNIVTLRRDDLGLGYRTSVFKKFSGRFVVLTATFRLSKNPQPVLSYPDVAKEVQGGASLKDIREAVMRIRARKFPDLEIYGTAGSFFLNPIMSAEDAERMQKCFSGMPTFVMPEGGVKIPLAWILDHVVGAKQMRVGGAFVWSEQALVIVTNNDATAYDVHELKKNIEVRVFEKTGIRIIPEVHCL